MASSQLATIYRQDTTKLYIPDVATFHEWEAEMATDKQQKP